MKILFVRHGKTDWNNQKKIQGSADILLSNEGIEHAKIKKLQSTCESKKCPLVNLAILLSLL